MTIAKTRMLRMTASATSRTSVIGTGLAFDGTVQVLSDNPNLGLSFGPRYRQATVSSGWIDSMPDPDSDGNALADRLESERPQSKRLQRTRPKSMTAC